MPRPVEHLFRKRSASVASWLFLMALVLAGCDGATGSPDAGSPDPDAGPPDAGPSPCVPGELTLADGTCQPAGLPPNMPCPPGELLLEDGKTCQKAGVPASACEVGFLPDGKEGCEPILPADACPEGQMAIPGDTACREIAPCGSGTWGDIPVEANTQFVNKSYAGGNSDGTQAKPWTTIQQGANAAAKGAIVAVAAGIYPEDVLIQGKAVRLWGRCPAMVEVVGTGATLGAIQVLQKGANGTEVHGVAVTGAKVGVGVSGASGVVIEHVWIHGAGNGGLNVQDDLGPTSVALKGSLVEKNHTYGVLVIGSDVVIEATAVRSTLPNALGQRGRGISARGSSKVMVRACLVEQNRQVGVLVTASDVTIEATVVRSTLLDEQGTYGRGIHVEDDPNTMDRAKVTVHGCLVEQNHDVGVFVMGSDATIEATVIRSTLPYGQGEFGFGLAIQNVPVTGARANVTIRACLVEQNQDAGVMIAGSDATIEATVVRSTLLDAQGTGGRGISIQNDANTKERANVMVHACLVEQNHDVGISVIGSDATIEATVIHSNLTNALGEGGRGINIQDDVDAKERGSVTVRACLIEQNHELGVFVTGSDATIEATVVRSTLPDALGEAGRGINIQDTPGTTERTKATVRACLIEQNQQMGVYVSGADATIEGAVVRSNLPDALGKAGRGINIQRDLGTNARASVIVRACLVEQNREIGVFVADSDATINASVVRDTAAQMSDDNFGDGIAAFEGHVTIQNVEVTHNARAGISSFGGHVVITDSVITCNAFDLEGELNGDIPFSFDGSTGWQCSDKAPAECTELGDCHVETTGIEAPSELPPADPLP